MCHGPNHGPLKQWLKRGVNVAHASLIARMATEAIVSKGIERCGECLLIRFHRSIRHLARANGPASYDSRISWFTKIPIETTAINSPGRARHDIIIAHVTRIQHPANIVVY